MANEFCKHIEATTSLKKATKHECEQCIKTGDTWMHLRTCQTCGVTLCCDSSPNTHMTKHFHKTKHPVVISSEPGERWLWCYVDEMIAEY
jgi:hypothetical protein